MGIFKAYDIRGLFPSEIDEDVAERIGKAVAQFLKVPLILVGRDMRLSGKSLNAALIKGIIGMGVDVMDIGLCSTPMCYFACAHLKAPASVMVTASHNPPQYNGFKLTREGAIPISGDTGIQEIEKIYSKNKFSGLAKKKGIITAKDIKESYKAHVLSFIAQKALKSVLEKKKIVVDAANGMGSLETSWILEQLPCRLVKLFCSIDGSFPNHEANPLKEENTRALQDRVLREKADLGIAFDGDADRVLFIDERGSRIPTDLITCLIARYCISNSLRIFLYRLAGVKIGKNVFIGIETFLDDQFPHLISIEDNVVISFRAILVVHDMKRVVRPITIRKNSYIGCGSIVLPGIIVGENSFVAAGSVVTKDVRSDVVVAGVPAKFLKKMDKSIR
ncbi:hypothetical protein HYU13_04545 [Candidatus Woesearchaeota archaeon]|nr:hypothetical protein [Candidatus Woesearchaeota archaeon]